MRLLHTSDWHLGRTFHGHPTTDALREVLAHLTGQVREHDVDAVLIAGDIFDHAAPAAELYALLGDVLRGLRDAGATVIGISGNHDSATRLGFQAEWAALGGIHLLTRPEGILTPVTLRDEHGPVHVYGIPYLEPALLRGRYGEDDTRSHAALLTRVLADIDRDAAERGGRSVALAHVFAVPAGADPAPPAAGLVRDITRGGLDTVPAQLFAGLDYAALGHIHGRATLLPTVRYSGAPLHLTFSEEHKPRGSWLIDLGPDGVTDTAWLDLPVPRPLAHLSDTLDALLSDERYEASRDHWVKATLTDPVRPLDAMRRLRDRFPHCAQLEYRPSRLADADQRSYTQRVTDKSDPEIVAEFLSHVRNGAGPDPEERRIIAAALAAATEGE